MDTTQGTVVQGGANMAENDDRAALLKIVEEKSPEELAEMLDNVLRGKSIIATNLYESFGLKELE